MDGRIVCNLFGVVVVMGEIVFSVLLMDDVVVAGSRLLGNGRVGVWIGRLVSCFAVGLWCWGRGALLYCCHGMLVIGPRL